MVSIEVKSDPTYVKQIIMGDAFMASGISPRGPGSADYATNCNHKDQGVKVSKDHRKTFLHLFSTCWCMNNS